RPAARRASGRVPTAITRPRAIATASASGRRGSSVRTRAFSRTSVTASVRRRQRLRFLELHVRVAADERAGPGLVAEHLDAALVAEVPLAELGGHAPCVARTPDA